MTDRTHLVAARVALAAVVVALAVPGDAAGRGAVEAAATRWLPVPMGEACGLFAAESTERFPTRTWEPCGDGCLTAPSHLPGEIAASLGRSSAATGADGAIVARLTMGNGSRLLVQIFSVEDGKTLGAIEQRAELAACNVAGFAPDAPRLVPFVREGGRYFAGRLAEGRGASSWRWQSRWIQASPVETSPFDLGDIHGFAFDDGRVGVVPDLESAGWREIEAGPTPARHVFGVDGAAVWTTGSSIKRWTREGLTTIASQPLFVASSAASSDKIVWIGTHGPSAREGSYDAAEIYWTPTSGPEAGQIHRGASIAARSGLSDLQTWGDYAATRGCGAGASPSCWLTVVRLSTDTVWTVQPRRGTRQAGVLAISPKEILVAEDGADHTGDDFPRLTRLALSELDVLAASR